MKNIYLAIFSAFIIFPVLLISACRKDTSAFIVPDQQAGGDNRNCQVLSYGTEDQGSVLTYKYELDSVLTELITTEEGQVEDAWYVKIENPKQLLVFHENKDPESARTRIYLNQDGSIEKEVAISLNPDGTTYSEHAEQANTFSYNSKKQLIRMDIKMDAGEVTKGVATITYDEQNRVNKIVFSDESGIEGLIYDNFSYDPHPKNDNFIVLDLFASPASYFIPSLRNVYIKGYRARTPLSDLLTTVFGFNYAFNDGKLAGMDMRVKVFGIDEEVKMTVTLKCK